MSYKDMTADQLNRLHFEAVKRGNHNAAAEIRDFQRAFGRRVTVVKGRKVPKGTTGTVFFVKRYDNSKFGDPFGIYSTTKIGFRDDKGYTYFTAIDNVEIQSEEDSATPEQVLQ